MKANYLLRNNYRQSRSKRLRKIFGTFIFGVLIFVLYQVSAWSLVKNFITSTRILFYDKSVLVVEKAALEEKVASLETKVALLEQAMVSEHEGKNMATAKVLLRPPENPYDVLTLGIESGNIVKVGSLAFLPNGILVGRVSESSATGIKVKLFSTVGEKMTATLERNNVMVEIIGIGSGNFQIRVPRDVSVEKEDKILFNNSDDLVAVVEDVSQKPTDSFKDILAKSPVNIFTIELLLIEP